MAPAKNRNPACSFCSTFFFVHHPFQSPLLSVRWRNKREGKIAAYFVAQLGQELGGGNGGEREQRQQDVPSAMSVYDPSDFLTISSSSSSVLVVGPSSLRLNLHYADVFPVLF